MGSPPNAFFQARASAIRFAVVSFKPLRGGRRWPTVLPMFSSRLTIGSISPPRYDEPAEAARSEEQPKTAHSHCRDSAGAHQAAVNLRAVGGIGVREPTHKS